jgi:hypothetical protein
MANGRMINHSITKDLRVNQLSDDTSRLAFTWLITFADREGRTYGDPAIVRSMIFPRRDDITVQQIAKYLSEWHDLGLVVWYEASGDMFIYFPAFDKNQVGMRKERESASIIPPPPGIDVNDMTDLLRTNSGTTPDNGRIKLKEVKRKEVKGKESNAATAAAVSSFQNIDARVAERVYTDITGQPTIPNDQIDSAISFLIPIISTYTDPKKLHDDGLGYFVRWCNSRGKNGRSYSRTNTAWLGWWAEALAPDPGPPEQFHIEQTGALCGLGETLKRKAEDLGNRDHEQAIHNYRKHIDTCSICGGKSVDAKPIPDEIRQKLRQLTGKLEVKNESAH